MILMALDHTRDFFTNATVDAADPAHSWPALFATRWVTHICAPGFVALAGMSVYLQRQRGKTAAQMAKLLVTRGLWLILIEVTVVSFGWNFSRGLILQVIWAVGAAMILLGVLQWAPRIVVGGLGAAMIVLHNLLDPVRAQSFGRAEIGWDLLHQFSIFRPHGFFVAAGYPLIPWTGVILVGYAAGPLALKEAGLRRRISTELGVAFLTVFAMLRATGGYGDHNHFVRMGTAARSAMSFMSVEKYPPSLHYLLATFGVLLLLYSALDLAVTRNWLRGVRSFVVTYGRVPFFYYVLHIYLLHTTALVMTAERGLDWRRWETPGTIFFGHVPGWGYGLPGVYLVWAMVVLALYLPCRWFSELKARRKDWWLSYL